MKAYFLLLATAILVFLPSSHAQTHRSMPFIEGLELYADSGKLNSSLIPDRPITNREYLTYLCWLHSVYAEYPEQFIEAFPGYSESNSPEYRKSLQIELDTTGFAIISNLLAIVPENILNYNFSPEFVDFPVMNVSWKQAMAFCNWLSDRYNEAILIDRKILGFDPMQTSMNCFTTESYLFNQYEGLLNKPFKDVLTGEERVVKWQDKILFPAFRLPTKKELMQIKLQKELKAYKSFQFLNLWIEFYLNTEGSKLVLQNPGTGQQLIISSNKADSKNYIFPALTEYVLDQSETGQHVNAYEIYKSLKQDILLKLESPVAEKDSLGQMRFILIGEDFNSNPIFVKRINYSPVNFNASSTFRFAVGTVR